jgi:hypothetical protein
VTARAEHVDAPQPAALGENGVSVANMWSGGAALPDPSPLPPATPPVRIASANTPDPVQNEAEEAARSVEIADTSSADAALPDPRPMRRPAALPMLFAAVSPADPVQNDARPAVRLA